MPAFVSAQRNVAEGTEGDPRWGQDPRGGSQDRVALVACEDGLIVALADGSGGVAGGAEAADLVIQAAKDPAKRPAEPTDTAAWCALLADLDDRIQRSTQAGESTAVLLFVNATGIFGASVGDSEAWMVLDDGFEDLTFYQQRKPLLGTGEAVPVPFHARPWSGTILVASDGLLHYGRLQTILESARAADLEASATALVDCVRLRSGKLQDDTSLVLVRRA